MLRIDCLRMEAEDGLSLAGLPALRIQQHAADLGGRIGLSN